MASPASRPPLLSTLRTRVLLLAAAFFVVLGIPAWLAFNHIVADTVLRVGTMLAEKQVQYDRYRGLETLNAEVTLAETLSRAPAILAWAGNEHDPALRQAGLAVFEHYRLAFADRSAFLVVDASGNYYFNDSQDSYGHDPYQYTVRADNPRDGWYFTTRQRREGCHLNVDHDDVLRVTKVWINCIVGYEGRVLGMIGTGIDLSAFIRDVVDGPHPGVQTMFVDRSGAVQAHRDASLVDFHSLTKDLADRSTVFDIIEDPADASVLRAMMSAAADPGVEVRTALMSAGGRPVLVGVGYLDRMGWYNVTIMDLDSIVDTAMFVPIGALLVGLMIVMALAMTGLFKLTVLDRLENVERGLHFLRDGIRARIVPDKGNDEIGRLSRALVEMSDAIADARAGLEGQIRERTEQLQTLVNLDALTGIFNRRGFAEAFAVARERARSRSTLNGVLLIDVDGFKGVNDNHGHLAGDQVAVEVARRLGAAIRRSDICGRWGGDEFIVLIRDCEPAGLRQVADAMSEMMRLVPVTLADGTRIPVTVSIGAAILDPEDTLEMATDMADAALYAAKEQGRDRVVVFEPVAAPRGDADPDTRSSGAA